MKRFTLLFLLAFALFIPHRAKAFRQSGCTRTIAATIVAIDQAIYGDQLNGTNHDGDVICVEAGTISTTGGLVMLGNHNIELRGAGTFSGTCPHIGGTCGSAGQTILLYRAMDGNSLLEVNEAATGSNIISNISFVFDTSSANPSNANGDLLTFKVGATGGKPIIWHHNTFNLTSSSCSYPKVLTSDTHRGVIYRNYFLNHPRADCGYVTTNNTALDAQYGDNGSFWDSASTMGSADTNGDINMYVETNYFEGFATALNSHSSARVVHRFNWLNGSSLADHGFDSSTYGERHTEAYNETFDCTIVVSLSSWMSWRGGTHMFFNNVFPNTTAETCGYPNGNISPIRLSQFKAFQCEEVNGWPGQYMTTYPISHQTGWGWINGSNQTVGDATAQGQPGGAGFQQALEPIYIFNNTGANSPAPEVSAQSAYQCQAMAYSNTSKSSGTTLVVGSGGIYVNSGQQIFATFADLVGGTAPTISDNCNGGQTWTALTGGTISGGIRQKAWTTTVNATCLITVTFTHDSSSAARAGTFVVMRNPAASPVHVNPAVRTYCPSGCTTTSTGSYDGPATGTLTGVDSTHADIVLGYYAINGPTAYNTSTFQFGNDTVESGGNGYRRAVYYGQSGVSATGIGINGTTGGAAGTNVSIGVIYKVVGVTNSETPNLVNQTAGRDAIAGTVAFKYNGGVSAANIRVEDLIQAEREYYPQNDSFTGATGTGAGPRGSRPMTCTTGVGYWSTDQGGNWNTFNGSANDGTLDKCTATDTWTNSFYTPYVYPHPLADVGNGDYLVFTVQPTTLSSGGTFSPTVVVTVTSPGGSTNTSATGNVSLTVNGCGASLTGTTTQAASMGVATFTGLGASTGGLPSSGCILTAAYSGTATSATSDAFSVNGVSTPTLTTAFPSIAVRGQTFSLTLTGTNLNTGNAAITVDGSGFTCSNVVVGSATTLTATCTIIGPAATTVRSVTVTTDTGTSGGVSFIVVTQGLGKVRPR